MATDDIETAIQRAAEKSRPPRKESLTSKVLKSWKSIEQYRANGGTVRALAAEMGIDEKQLSQAIFQARKQIEKRGGNATQLITITKQEESQNSNKQQPIEQPTPAKTTKETLAKFDMTTAEGRRAAQEARFKSPDDEGK